MAHKSPQYVRYRTTVGIKHATSDEKYNMYNNVFIIQVYADVKIFIMVILSRGRV
jgi:hypothetical protein